MALRNLFRGGHDDGQYGRDPWDRNGVGDWEHLGEEHTSRATDERGLRYQGGYGERSYRAERNELGEGFERRGWRPGSDYYGNDPERYGAGNYDAGAFGAGREPGPFRGRGPKGYRRSDERIREDVCECLSADDRVDASDIDVTVRNCEVTLSGTVISREQKRRAEDLIERIAGVKDVNNGLRVAGQSSQEQESTVGMSEQTRQGARRSITP
jgi:hypothetical protein